MTYKTLMVHLDLEADNQGLLQVTGDLAQHFKAHVIGIAACQPTQILFDEGITAGEVMVEDRAEITTELKTAESRFRAALKDRVQSLEWRSCITYEPLSTYISDQARAADLIIAGPDMGASLFDNNRRVKIGEMAIEAGRPVLIVPHGVSSLDLRHVLVGWKETREARRAVADALPLLARAGQVTLLEAADAALLGQAEARLTDVACWLERHGIEAMPCAVPINGPESNSLKAELARRGGDLIVAGAYGHSRLGEFAFGGVTRDVLLDINACVLISH